MPHLTCRTIFLSAIFSLSMATASAAEDSFKVESLRCPGKDSADLELVSRDGEDQAEKIIAVFEGSQLSEVMLYGSENGGPFELIFRADTKGTREDVTEFGLSAGDMDSIFDGLVKKVAETLKQCG